MSNPFTQQNVEAFLVDSGATEDDANFVSNFVVVAVRTTSSGAEIKEQSVNEDFTGYNAVLDGGLEDIKVAYAATKRGSGFFEHGVTVTCGEQTYGLNRLVHTPVGVVDNAPEQIAEEVTTEEVVVEEPAAATAPIDVVDEVAVAEVVVDEVVVDEVVVDEVAVAEVVVDEVEVAEVEVNEVDADEAEPAAAKAKAKKKAKK